MTPNAQQAATIFTQIQAKLFILLNTTVPQLRQELDSNLATTWGVPTYCWQSCADDDGYDDGDYDDDEDNNDRVF